MPAYKPADFPTNDYPRQTRKLSYADIKDLIHFLIYLAIVTTLVGCYIFCCQLSADGADLTTKPIPRFPQPEDHFTLSEHVDRFTLNHVTSSEDGHLLYNQIIAWEYWPHYHVWAPDLEYQQELNLNPRDWDIYLSAYSVLESPELTVGGKRQPGQLHDLGPVWVIRNTFNASSASDGHAVIFNGLTCYHYTPPTYDEASSEWYCMVRDHGDNCYRLLRSRQYSETWSMDGKNSEDAMNQKYVHHTRRLPLLKPVAVKEVPPPEVWIIGQQTILKSKAPPTDYLLQTVDEFIKSARPLIPSPPAVPDDFPAPPMPMPD